MMVVMISEGGDDDDKSLSHCFCYPGDMRKKLRQHAADRKIANQYLVTGLNSSFTRASSVRQQTTRELRSSTVRLEAGKNLIKHAKLAVRTYASPYHGLCNTEYKI